MNMNVFAGNNCQLLTMPYGPGPHCDNTAAKSMSECNKDTAGSRHVGRIFHYVTHGILMKERKFHWIGNKFQLADLPTKEGGPSKFKSLEEKCIINLEKF